MNHKYWQKFKGKLAQSHRMHIIAVKSAYCLTHTRLRGKYITMYVTVFQYKRKRARI